ncbi:prolyl-tRNA synthetase [Candidatus Nomurabacteria bacterium RIFCSPHIGHO2_01_FULL_37_25]|uniref:Proline--tRNA ligase n=1 Tax=Candidatus Nomurabacteria bacterium RIFCSPLOWO2_01_FULL_36_16 TaxID=1801767 RepID=A0A1F6X0E1_9BACT|nr:MAG: prolyl-tRNA synthetase [Candidatus Nomurabacteria bacterium RIFCSPHIGHO2_01_FULL_37_25]OGI75090.1 MAG: prolyl-tRNA synthetase [Candidatus Nomurabacteria bacterium RIFCSPHIGHO2_02_FULL_36_29]OGI87601.1 MAG: prolyl-tRNA synthetase [Candidatus Nomurabacteria bacterium RIFCSPLOWO2_01_FULL_36_16]
MRQSKLFTKTRREIPADEVSKNAQLLIRGGFINKEMAGVYDYLPLGLLVLKKIENIIREEMNAIGGQEVLMSTLQRPELWERTDRWDDNKLPWFKTNLRVDADHDKGRSKELGLATTHEEPVSNMLEQFISSYKNLPFSLYQFQTKFRNEVRARSGIIRTREFIMKDLYSFSKDEKEHEKFYEQVKEAYKNIFKRTGIGHLTYLTFASGGAFSKFSHEFQTITSAGEDTIYVDENKGMAVNKEVYNDEVIKNLGLSKDTLVENKAVEVGNIFTLGTKFSDPHLVFTNEKGKNNLVFMGSYGIGPGRLMGTVVEVLSDDKGIIWPESIAPFQIHLLALGEDEVILKESNKIYETLVRNNVEVLFDDRLNISSGEKFSDADLMGIPLRAVVSARSLKEGGIEIKKRVEEKGKIISEDELLKLCLKNSIN